MEKKKRSVHIRVDDRRDFNPESSKFSPFQNKGSKKEGTKQTHVPVIVQTLEVGHLALELEF